jgi:hypothetical protein
LEGNLEGAMLSKALDLPLPSSVTEALGIHQSDVIIRTAIIAGIADLRANPWLLDYVFKSLARDQLTLADYGERDISQAKEWFLKTDIPVFMNTRIDAAKLPCISIGLQESVEAEATLGDVHYVPSERSDAVWPVLIGPFTPAAFNAGSGLMKVPAAALGTKVLTPGMVLLDSAGREYPVLEVLDDDTIAIAPNTVADFRTTCLKGARPQFLTELESLSFRETYQIGCHAQGEAVHLTYLHSIIVFLLLRYKQALLESRGFERSTVSSSNFMRNDAFENELVFSRFVTITGYVRNYWPKAFSEGTEAITGPLGISTGGAAGESFVTDTGEPPSGDETWLADEDTLLAKLT